MAYTTTERIYVDATKAVRVHESDPRAAFLFAAANKVISDEDALRLGLIDHIDEQHEITDAEGAELSALLEEYINGTPEPLGDDVPEDAEGPHDGGERPEVPIEDAPPMQIIPPEVRRARAPRSVDKRRR